MFFRFNHWKQGPCLGVPFHELSIKQGKRGCFWPREKNKGMFFKWWDRLTQNRGINLDNLLVLGTFNISKNKHWKQTSSGVDRLGL